MTFVAVTMIGLGAISATTETPASSKTIDDRREEAARPNASTRTVCPEARAGLAFYRTSYSRARKRMGLPAAPRYVRYGCVATRRRAEEWRLRSMIERTILEDWERTVGVVVDRLNRGLSGTPLAGLGATFEAAGRKYGVSPYFMAAASGTESSFGSDSCSNNRKNVWGLAACDGRWHVPYFETWKEAVEFYARFLSSRWPTASTPYSYSGYAECGACWGRKTSAHMGRFGVGNSTRYPARLEASR